MARHPKKNPLNRSPKSPEGFWPNPEKELFNKPLTPPWEVPRKRKTRGREPDYYYNVTNDNIEWKKCGEITTSNRFDYLEALNNTNDLETLYSTKERNECGEVTTHDRFKQLYQEEETKTSGKKKETPPGEPQEEYQSNTENIIISESFDDFMKTESKYIGKNKHYMYKNKYNFCSGYFPDFITLDVDIGYDISEGNDYSHYYLYTKNNAYLKPLSDPKSKYNNKYFIDMNFAYKISKKHSWVDEPKSNTSLFNSHSYKKLRLQTLRDTRIGIPEDMNRTYSSEESRIGNQRGSMGIKKNEMIENTLWNSRIGVPKGTHSSEDPRIGIQRGNVGFEENELFEHNLWNSRIGVPIGTHPSEESRIGILRGSEGIGKKQTD